MAFDDIVKKADHKNPQSQAYIGVAKVPVLCSISVYNLNII